MIPCLSVGTGGTRCISVRWEKVNHKQVAGNTIDRLPVVEVFFRRYREYCRFVRLFYKCVVQLCYRCSYSAITLNVEIRKIEFIRKSVVVIFDGLRFWIFVTLIKELMSRSLNNFVCYI